MNSPEPAVEVLDARARQAYAWACAALGLDGGAFAPASADASFRRYFRLMEGRLMEGRLIAGRLSAGARSWIVMDAPPQQEDCRPFLHVATLMRQAGVHVPEVLAEDLAQGYLLLSDLGTRTYLEVLGSAGTVSAETEVLFADAIDALILWQRASRAEALPPYDEALLRRELQLFPDWYLARHRGLQLQGEARAALEAVFDQLVAAALAQPRVYVHRDYMPRNLMASSPNPGVLDFQDAVYGPIAYDPLCLFQDAFLSWPAEFVDWGLSLYRERACRAGLPLPEAAQFRRDCRWIGVQRHLKVLGIFARIRYRDGRPRYLADAPRFIRYLRAAAQAEPALVPLLRLFDAWELQA